jgi:thiaminase
MVTVRSVFPNTFFVPKVVDYIALVDDTCKTASAETLQEMEKHFIMSCKLEHMFWDQAEALMDWPKILRGSDS